MPAFTGAPAALYPAGHKLIDTELKTWFDGQAALAGTWNAYTPALTGVTLGNGTIVGEYVQDGKLVHFKFALTRGSTTVFTGGVSIGLPVTGSDGNWAGIAFLFSSLTGASRMPGVLNPFTTTVQVFGPTGQVTATVPFTWATGDVIKGSGTYEAA